MADKVIDLGNGKTVAFPDSMSDDEIGKAITADGHPDIPTDKPGFVSTFLHDINPLNSVPAIWHGLTDTPDLAKVHLDSPIPEKIGPPSPGEMAPGRTPGQRAYNASLPSVKAQQAQDAADGPGVGELLGHHAAGAVNGLALGALTDGVVRGAGAAAEGIAGLRTPNPDLDMLHAASPHAADTDFMDNIGKVRSNMQRGAELNGTPVTDVPTAIDAAKTSMDEHMAALEAHKVNSRNAGNTLSTKVIKTRQIAALPEGLADRDPAAYKDAVDAINAQWPGKPILSTDEVFDNAKLNNSQLSAFHAGKPSAQNSKLITNGGDTAVLKSAGDTYRQWIHDTMGPEAAQTNADWGQMNGVKHYLEAKINPALKETPRTALDGLLNQGGISAEMLRRPGHSIVSSLLSKLTGVPEGINNSIESAFAHTAPAGAPFTPDVAPLRIPAPADASGPQYNWRNNPMEPTGQKALAPPGTAEERAAAYLNDVLVRHQAGQAPAAGGRTGPALLPAPEPGQPPLNVIHGSAGPAGSDTLHSVNTPVPAGKVNGPGLDEFGRPIRPQTTPQDVRRATTNPPGADASVPAGPVLTRAQSIAAEAAAQDAEAMRQFRLPWDKLSSSQKMKVLLKVPSQLQGMQGAMGMAPSEFTPGAFSAKPGPLPSITKEDISNLLFHGIKPPVK